MRRNVDVPRFIFIVSLVFLGLAGSFLFGALAYRYSLPPFPQIRETLKLLENPGSLSGGNLMEHLQPSRGQGDGVTVNLLPQDGSTVLMAGFFDGENQARLITRDGTVIRKWSLGYFEHFPDPDAQACKLRSDLHTDIHGAVMTREGELVFNYEYCGTVKLDRCGAVVWTLPAPTHHSIIPAESGGYWVLGRTKWRASSAPDRFPPFSTPATNEVIEEDTLIRLSEDGDVLEEVSIPQLMRDGGLEAQLTANGEIFFDDWVRRNELVHANKAAELRSSIAGAFSQFSAGDLMISFRELNLIIVIDPETKAVKWHRTGPWIRQHDPEFRPDGKISVFNNNAYRTAYHENQTDLSTPFSTNIMLADPDTGETEITFGGRPGQEMLSVIRGQHELLEGDGMIITEFDAGRVMQVNAEREIVWQYVNRYDDDFVGEISNAAVYPVGYFRNGWESCP